MLKINWWAVIVAAIASVALGFIIYRALGGVWVKTLNEWAALGGFDPADDRPWVGFFITVAGNLVIAAVMAVLMVRLGVQSLARGLAFGLLVGGGLMITTLIVQYSFIQVPVPAALVDSAFVTLRAAATGIILGIWPRRA